VTDIQQLLQRLITRSEQSHKGDFGSLVVVLGDESMKGASILAALSALCMGLGKVQIFAQQSVGEQINIIYPDIIVYQASTDVQSSFEQCIKQSGCTAVLIGPGLGQEDASAQLLETVLQVTQTKRLPIALDAGALTQQCVSSCKHFADDHVVLTPHPGEFKRLFPALADSYAPTNEARRACLTQAVSTFNQVVVLKGAATLVASRHFFYVCDKGNATMAVAGMGDVLSGMIAALLARGFVATEAAQLGVYLHALAGDIAAEDLGVSLKASDMMSYIPKAIQAAIRL